MTRALLVVVLLAGSAHADVDWQAGHVAATGLGIADRHAPSPAAAREPARRKASDIARASIARELRSLPLAAGGTLEAKLADTAIKASVDRAVAAAITLDAKLHTDGSWTVKLAVPIEAIRQAISGPRGFTKDDDAAIVVVEGVKAKPALGFTVGGVSAPTLWVTEIPAWAKDAPRVKATAAKAGAIELAAKQGGPATLFVLVR